MPLVEFETDASPEEVGQIRRSVVPLLTAALTLTPEEAEDLELMVSELVTNGWLYGCRRREGSKLGFRADVAKGGRLRVEVTDPAAPGVRVQRRRGASEGGRGLLIISRLAKEHGSERNWEAGGTRTSWFEMEIASLLPKESEEETAAAVSSAEAAPTSTVNTAALNSRIRHARPTVVVGTIGPPPLAAAA
ncbi:ATP-binding protein [Kitasatospora sp. NPDC004669]|uniref:ATP-binding protein n=1 Tax=Kitasatospora sp. NPDC004669 TaxID=3154555 RepID=UPI0033A676B2